MIMIIEVLAGRVGELEGVDGVGLGLLRLGELVLEGLCFVLLCLDRLLL